MSNRYYIGNPKTILTPTVAIGTLKQKPAGGTDANESKAF